MSAFSVGNISYKYGLLIEGSSSVEFLQKKVTPMMFSDYCLAVRDCSTAQYSAKVQEITTYILEHLPSELTVNQLAELFFLNVSSLSRKFKSETGFSVTEFTNFHRIKLAQYYLSQGNRSITEVAYLVGYNDSNYFCRMFKKVTSITPSQYLKNVSGRFAGIWPASFHMLF
ncbi:helix-turn-helix domain-containing protein [Hungatella hathewayi]|uniref:helix-turn-helix domain-containing protein n=1 Tax=Hungatella hathewayi TaxID=154046 RepID=UPI003566AC14